MGQSQRRVVTRFGHGQVILAAILSILITSLITFFFPRTTSTSITTIPCNHGIYCSPELQTVRTSQYGFPFISRVRQAHTSTGPENQVTIRSADLLGDFLTWFLASLLVLSIDVEVVSRATD
ncbi:MAG TPA: hypothetical protein VGS28_02935 [Candidatus Saccharimonadales bacterium]|nr:hypothetical protein [Candidatus Saccharimonadales bacterium]